MDAARIVRAADDRPWAGTVAPLRTVVAVACMGGLLLFCSVVIARRLASGCSAPLGGATMFAAGCFLATLAGAARGCWAGFGVDHRSEAKGILANLSRSATPSAKGFASYSFGLGAGQNVARWAPLAIALVSAMVLLAGAWSFGNLAAIGLPLGVVALANVPMIQSRVLQGVDGVRERGACGKRILSRTGAPKDSETNAADSRDAAPDEDDDVGVTQRWTRRVVDGWDTLDGWQQASVERGARVVQMHVAICPAFAGMPEASVEQIDGEAASMRVAEATAFGLRVEVRLDEPASEAGSLTVAIAARAALVAR